jgi:hypothetical protein
MTVTSVIASGPDLVAEEGIAGVWGLASRAPATKVTALSHATPHFALKGCISL